MRLDDNDCDTCCILAALMARARFRKCQFDQNEGRGLDKRTVDVAKVKSGANQGQENQAVRLDATMIRHGYSYA